jgi:hypothetical protein
MLITFHYMPHSEFPQIPVAIAFVNFLKAPDRRSMQNSSYDVEVPVRDPTRTYLMPEANASWGLCVDAANARYNILVLAASPQPNLNFSRRHHGFPVLIFIQSLIPCVL